MFWQRGWSVCWWCEEEGGKSSLFTLEHCLLWTLWFSHKLCRCYGIRVSSSIDWPPLYTGYTLTWHTHITWHTHLLILLILHCVVKQFLQPFLGVSWVAKLIVSLSKIQPIPSIKPRCGVLCVLQILQCLIEMVVYVSWGHSDCGMLSTS